MDNSNTKKCPFCSEDVLIEAKKCKHCGETIDVALRVAEEAKRNASSMNPTVFMNAGGASSSSASSAASSGADATSSKAGCGCLVKIIAAIFGIILILSLTRTNSAKSGASNTETKSSQSDTISKQPSEQANLFNVILKDVGSDKIATIEALRSIYPQMSLSEAKEFVERAPIQIKSGVTKEEAKEIKKRMDAAGANVSYSAMSN